MVEHKLVSFAAIQALWTVLQLYFTFRILLKQYNLQGENYIILSAMLRKQSYSVRKVLSRSFGIGRSSARIFIKTPKSRTKRESREIFYSVIKQSLHFFPKKKSYSII